MSDYQEYQNDLDEQLLWQQDREFQKIRDLENRRANLERRFKNGDESVRNELIKVIDELNRLAG